MVDNSNYSMGENHISTEKIIQYNRSLEEVSGHVSPEKHSFLGSYALKPLLMWISATFLYCYQFFLRSSPNVMEDVLRQEFLMDAESFGLLASFYYIAYSILQIPMGVLIDKIGLRRILTFSAAMCSFGAFIFGLSDGLMMAKIGRFCMGMGSAGVFLSCLKLITLWFPRRRFGIFLGLTMMMGTFGAISAGAPLALLVQGMGWRLSLLSFSVLGMIWALLLWLVVRDRKAPLGLKSEEVPIPLFVGLKRVITNPQIWLAALYGTTMYAVLSAFADLWGTPYLMHAYDLDKPSAAAASTSVYVGLALGGPFFGYLSERFKSRKMPMLMSACGGLLFFSLFLYVSDLSITFVYICLFAVGFFVGGKLMNFAVATDSVPYSLSGTATGFVNGCCMTSGIIFQPLIGKLMCYNWDGKMVNGVARYATSDYCFALSAIPVCMILAGVITLMTKESYPKST